MIPLKLHIKNFLSYGSEVQIIDFEPYQLICLSGKNGHGKSALLDAISWAIWGHARKIQGVAKADEALLRLGQKQMMVCLDIQLNEQRYRIRREFMLTHGKPFVSLDIGMVHPDESVVSFSEKTIRATQEKINTLLGLDYEAFINSVFLRQGQSNEFSKKSPKERKEMLSSILGLTVYETLRKQALEKARTTLQEKEQYEKLQEHLAQELSQKNSITTALQSLEQEITAVITHENELLLRIHQIEQALATHQQRNHETVELREKIVSCKEQLQKTMHASTQQHQAHMQQQQLLSKELQLTIAQWHQQKTDVDTLITQTETEHARIRAELQKTRQVRDLIYVTDEQYQKTEQQFEKRTSGYHQLTAYEHKITAQLQELAHKKQLTHESAEALCPVCEQTLSASRKQLLQDQCAHQESRYTHQLHRIQLALKELKEKLIKQREELKKLRQHKQEYLNAQTLIAQQERQEQTTAQHLVLLAAKKKKLVDTYPSLQQALEQAQQQLLQAQQQETALIHNNPDCLRLRQEITQHLDRLKACEQAQLTDAPAYAALLTEKKEVVGQRTAYQTTKEKLFQNKGALEHQKTKLAHREHEYEENKKKILTLTHIIDQYQEIGKALGKDGIQALLIEEAIPEIEHEANNLLARLTDNQSHLFIESIRDLKKGGTKETLDIKISDAAGIRSYELFSGGEAFRIDFALRIAISKLLSRRAGASLQTLIIDEGFGSQDDDGLAMMMDAIYKIQDEFAKVIVVSHLASMKDQFPTQFVIEKGLNGSCVTVVRQD